MHLNPRIGGFRLSGGSRLIVSLSLAVLIGLGGCGSPVHSTTLGSAGSPDQSMSAASPRSTLSSGSPSYATPALTTEGTVTASPSGLARQQAQPPLCPATATAPDVHSNGKLDGNPQALRLCSLGVKDQSTAGVVVGQESARTLAELLDSEPTASSGAMRCEKITTDILLRFDYRNGSTVDVRFFPSVCPWTVAFVAGQARLVDRVITNTITGWATGNDQVQPGRAAPVVQGATLNQAIQIAARSGVTLGFDGEEIDSSLPDGSILLQDTPVGYRTSANQLGVVLAFHQHPACNVKELALQFGGVQGIGGGAIGGPIFMRDVGSQPCLFQGPIKVVGVDRAGKPDTNTVTLSIDPNIILTPAAKPLPPQLSPPFGEVVAVLGLEAYPDGTLAGSNQMCQKHQFAPAFWRLTLASGSAKVANSDTWSLDPRNPSLITCNDGLDTFGSIDAE